MVAPADGNTRIQRQPSLPQASTGDPPRQSQEPAIIAPATGPIPQPVDGLQTAPESVTVKSGDSLFLIAARHQVTMDQLRKLNPELFGSGQDASGNPRSVDGGLIYPGDMVRLRPAPAPAPAPQQASQKVVTAAKDFIDAANPGEHPSPDQLLESARRMMDLIPTSDPDHERLKARIDALSRPATTVEGGGGPTSGSVPPMAATGSANLVGPLPGLPVAPTAPQGGPQAPSTVQPSPAYPQPAPSQAPGYLPQPGYPQPGYPQPVSAQPQPGAPQVQVPQPPVPAPLPGQPGWPTSPTPGAVGTTPYPDVPQAVVGKVLPMQVYYPDGTSYSPMSESPTGRSEIPPGGPGTVLPPPGAPPAPGMIYVAGAPIIQRAGHWVSTTPPAGAPRSGQSGPSSQTGAGNQVAANQNGTPAANGAAAEPSGPKDPSNPRGKDPQDPRVQEIERFLATARDSDVVKLVQDDSMKLLASTPAQKARMLQILLAGRTTGTEQDAILAILRSAQDQGESAAALDVLDRLEGGAGKGALRLNEDLERPKRQQMLATLTSAVPFDEKYPPAFYQNLAARMEKADIEALGSGAWLTTMPDTVKAAFIQKLQAPWWWPFGGNPQLAQQIQSTLGR
ncbi:MAG: LysM peptidoglycan-binding domain-containing protein [bacterium]|nr:LysM peptidoglycan-binding domain-containing protein [bacterium]